MAPPWASTISLQDPIQRPTVIAMSVGVKRVASWVEPLMSATRNQQSRLLMLMIV